MIEPRKRDQGLAEGQKYLALGLKFAAGIVGFTLAGLGLDRWLGWTPVLTVAGAVIGTILSFLSVYWELVPRNGRSGR